MPETKVDQMKTGSATAPEFSQSPILEQSLREQGERATERSKYRSLAQKLFREGKVTGIDMAIEEAMGMNILIDQKVEEGVSMSDAVKQVSMLPEFKLKGLRNIQKEEYVRAKALQFAHALEENKFLKAKVLRKLPQFEVDDATVEVYQDAVKTAINQHAGDLVREKDGKNFRRIVSGFAGDIQRGRMQVTDEEIRAPEIQNPIREDLVESFRYHTPFTPDKFAQRRDKLVGMGIVDGAEINALPEIQQIARQKLTDSFSYHTPFTPGTFVEERDALVKIGIVSAEEVNSIPQIQETARQRMIDSFRYHTPYTPETFAQERDALVKAGVVKEADMNKLPEIQEEAQKKLIASFEYHTPFTPNRFAEERDALIKIGIVKTEDISKVPEIQAEARKKLVASYRYHTPYTPESFAKERDALIALGIVDIETVETWIREANLASAASVTV